MYRLADRRRYSFQDAHLLDHEKIDQQILPEQESTQLFSALTKHDEFLHINFYHLSFLIEFNNIEQRFKT